MFKRICKLLSAVLVFALFLQMLPLQVFALNYRARLSDKITLPNISATESVTAAIGEEIPANRTAFSKEYKLENGLHMAAVYANQVHYETADGWEEIDNTLKLAEGSYVNTAGLWQVALPQQLSRDSRISISKDGYTLRFGMSGQLRLDDSVAVMSATAEPSTKIEQMGISQAQVSPKNLLAEDTPAHMAVLSEKNHSRLSYGNVYENTNVIYDLQGSKVKESVILAAHDSDLVGYRYVLETGELAPVLNEDGSIGFYDAEKRNVVMIMEAPFLVDNNGEHTNDIRVTLTGKDGTYYLSYYLPRQWLAQSERAWPVILDPVISANNIVTNINDITVAENTTFSSIWGINEAGYSNKRGVEWFFLKYLSLPTLGSADMIVNAQVQLYKPQNSSNYASIEVRKVLDNWNTNTTWATRPPISQTVEDFTIVNPIGNYTWDVTEIAKGWYEGENTGMVFKGRDVVEQTQENNWKQFHSSDMGSHPPVLTITYRNNSGLESYWDYSSFSAGRAGTGYVNNFTGNLVWTRADLGFGGTRASVAISHIYNASDVGENQFGMGYGWRTNYNQLVYAATSDSSCYAWEDGDGTVHYFNKVSTGTYKDEDGLELTLKTNGSGTSKYTITDKGGNVTSFDTKGRLTQIANNQATKSVTTVTYTTDSGYLIDTITDAIGRRYVFTYNADGLLTKIEAQNSTQQAMTQVTYEYENGLLTGITDKDGEEATYSYNSSKLLTTAEDIDGYLLSVAYNSTDTGKPCRVTKVCEQDGNVEGGELTFTYAQNQTTIEDYSGNSTVYQFNTWGNTVSIQDGEGRAQFAKYATDNNETGKGNQLTAASKLQNTVTNLLTDSSFENGTLWNVISGSPDITITTEQACYGSKSLKVIPHDKTIPTGEIVLVSPCYTIAPGESFTFSAYIKVISGSAGIGIGPTNPNSWETIQAASEWQRVQINHTNNTQENQPIYGFITVSDEAYIDCVQLEKSPTASRYNLIDNGDFSATGGWEGTGLETGDGLSAPAIATSWLGTQAYKLTGDAFTAKSIKQEVAVSGSEGDVFVLAGWAQGDGVPIVIKSDNRQRSFGLKAVFHYADGDSSDPITVSFNPDAPYWQYAATALVAPEDYTSITVTVEYDYGMNAIYFDGIGLYKEPFSASYVYDEEGNVTSVTDLQDRKTTYEYQNNDLTKETLPDGLVMTYTYDTYHNVLTATSSTGLVYTFTYDTYGNNTSVSVAGDGKTLTSSATYSANGNAPVTTTDTAGNVTTYRYDPHTNVLEWVEYPEDNDSDKTFYTYDEMYRVISTSLGEVLPYQEVSYTYTDDLLTEITTSSTSYTFEYGDFGLRSNIMVANRLLAQYNYEERTNRLTKLIYGNDDFIEYTYDEQGRVTKDTYEDGETVSYLYDNSGALASVIDSGSGITTTYYYDFIDRLAKYAEQGNGYSHSVEYGYDTENNLSTLKETINGILRTTGYTYDEDNRLDTLTAEGHTVDYTYDGFGRIEKQEVKNGTQTVLTTTYTYYEPTESTTSTQIKSIQQTAGTYSLTLSYTYDDNGNILTISDGTNILRYQYGEGNKLTREDDPIAGVSTSYVYGENGNPFAELRRPYGDNPGNVQTGYVDYGWDSQWGDMLTNYGALLISYDNIGNMLGDCKYTYTWAHGRELATMTDSTGTWTFTYDANGMRTGRSRTGSTGVAMEAYRYVYNGSQLSQMRYGMQDINFFYDGEGRPAYFTYNNTTYYYVTNLQGDVIAILDSTGAVMVNYYYDAYGVLLQTGGSMASTLGTLNPLTYRGYVYDHETGLYYLQSRYYNPTIRQFISPDAFVSTGQGITGYNMFAYCGNNPVNYSDPTGTYRDYDTRPIFGGGGPGGPGAGYYGLSFAGGISTPSVGSYVTDAMTSAYIVAGTGIAVAATVKLVEKIAERNHSVYVLKDADGTVQYVGRTKSVEKRRAAHSANPARKGLIMEVIASGLNLLEARALEQAGMVYYHTINTTNKMNNQINGIAPKYWGAFKEIALGTLNYIDNKMTNAILCWAEN